MIIRMALEIEIEGPRLKGLYPNVPGGDLLAVLGAEVAEQIEDRYGAFVRELKAHSVPGLSPDDPEAPDGGAAIPIGYPEGPLPGGNNSAVPSAR